MNPRSRIMREFPLPFLTQEGLVAMTPSDAKASQPQLTSEHRRACFARLLTDLIRQRVQENRLAYIHPAMHIGAGADLITADHIIRFAEEHKVRISQAEPMNYYRLEFVLPAEPLATLDGVGDQGAIAPH
jgi:hypothetical protein